MQDFAQRTTEFGSYIERLDANKHWMSGLYVNQFEELNLARKKKTKKVIKLDDEDETTPVIVDDDACKPYSFWLTNLNH